MTGSITHFLKNAWADTAWQRSAALCLGVLLVLWASFAASAELEQLKVERADDGIYLSANVQFELAPVVEDALVKGIPLFFVVEADIYRDRWYWTDRRVASATRTIRLAFQPLTRRWRINIVSGLISNSAGLRATLNQNYDSLEEAIGAIQRLSRWKIADNSEIDTEAAHKLEFRFSLDLSQLPRPFQIGVAGQKEWTIAVDVSQPLKLERPATETSRHRGAAPASEEKIKPVLTAVPASSIPSALSAIPAAIAQPAARSAVPGQ